MQTPFQHSLPCAVHTDICIQAFNAKSSLLHGAGDAQAARPHDFLRLLGVARRQRPALRQQPPVCGAPVLAPALGGGAALSRVLLLERHGRHQRRALPQGHPLQASLLGGVVATVVSAAPFRKLYPLQASLPGLSVFLRGREPGCAEKEHVRCLDRYSLTWRNSLLPCIWTHVITQCVLMPQGAQGGRGRVRGVRV